MNVEENVKFERRGDSSVRMAVKIGAAETEKAYGDALKGWAQKAQIPGFRKGKAPLSVLEKKFGESLRRDVGYDLVEKKISEAFKENGDKSLSPLPYAPPLLEGEINFAPGEDFSFAVTYDVMPQISVGGIESIEIEEPVSEITAADVEREFKSIQERNASVISKKEGAAAESGDLATISYFERDDDGNKIKGSERDDFVCTVGEGQTLFDFDGDILGMKKGESKEVEKNFPQNYKFPEYAGRAMKFSLSLKELKARELPALDDELAKDVSEKFQTFADLKADVERNLKATLDAKILEIKNTALVKKLVEANPFTIPKSMMAAELESRWQNLAEQFRTTGEKLEKIFASSGKSKSGVLAEWESEAALMLKGELIIETLMEERKISVDDGELEAKYAEIAKDARTDVAEVKKVYENQAQKDWLLSDMKREKLFASLFSEIKIKRGERKTFAQLFERG